jgi:hypothetical protein
MSRLNRRRRCSLASLLLSGLMFMTSACTENVPPPAATAPSDPEITAIERTDPVMIPEAELTDPVKVQETMLTDRLEIREVELTDRLEIRAEHVIINDADCVRLWIKNPSDQTYIYGDDYAVEGQIDGTWQNLLRYEADGITYAFRGIGFPVPPGSERVQLIDLNEIPLADVVEGTPLRLTKSFLLERDADTNYLYKYLYHYDLEEPIEQIDHLPDRPDVHNDLQMEIYDVTEGILVTYKRFEEDPVPNPPLVIQNVISEIFLQKRVGDNWEPVRLKSEQIRSEYTDDLPNTAQRSGEGTRLTLDPEILNAPPGSYRILKPFYRSENGRAAMYIAVQEF